MKKALITGSSHGIGYAITQALLGAGYAVVGISKTSSGIKDANFEEHLFDLTDLSLLDSTVQKLLLKGDFDILINNAGVAYYGPHRDISPQKLHEMVATNLEVPMVLSKLLLPSLISTKGMIINISSVTAKNNSNTHGVAYGATKAGLTSFGNSLFNEVRKNDVRVVNIHPEMTDTMLYRNADFGADTTDGASLSAMDIADQILHVLDTPVGININDITLTPQYNRIARKKKHE